MYKYLLLLISLSAIFNSRAQNSIEISVKNSTLITTDSLLPFWFEANQYGKIRSPGQVLNVSDFNISQTYRNQAESPVSYTWGGNLVAAVGETGYFQVNQLFAGILWNGWELKAGMFHEPERHGGLSTTNGNIARSQNARPYPMVRVSTYGFKPVPGLHDWLSFKAEYDEGILNDKRFVDRTHIHHKSFYFLVQPDPSWDILAGVEHFVMWGGTSRDETIGELPRSFNAYLRYITGTSGDEEFPDTDQRNVAGNQLGTYQLEVTKKFSAVDATFYLSHPFEDKSGVNWRNWPDNVLGVHFNFKNQNKLITGMVYEFTNTRQQSIRDSFYVWNETSGEWVRQENDNYFNNSVYKSGYTYHQQVMSSPLFFPVVKENGIAGKIRSNRFFAHHLGLKGNFADYFKWNGLLTYTQHLGTYGAPFKTQRKQLSGLLGVQYIKPGFPVEIGVALAADKGNVTDDNFGFQFWIAKRW